MQAVFALHRGLRSALTNGFRDIRRENVGGKGYQADFPLSNCVNLRAALGRTAKSDKRIDDLRQTAPPRAALGEVRGDIGLSEGGGAGGEHLGHGARL